MKRKAREIESTSQRKLVEIESTSPEEANEAKTAMLIRLEICAGHGVIAPFTCQACLVDKPHICHKVVCEICVSDRKLLCDRIGMDHGLCKLNKYLCNDHFANFAERVSLGEDVLAPGSVEYKGMEKKFGFFGKYHCYFRI